TGSHLDSVVRGGRFDGIAGVCAAMDVARVVGESRYTTTRTWRFVAFAAEEGARFGQPCNGSRAAAGHATPAQLNDFYDADGVSIAKAMVGVGLDPLTIEDARWHAPEWHAFVELHVEQGNVLETAETPIGIVDAISGSTRLRVALTGVASHTGG